MRREDDGLYECMAENEEGSSPLFPTKRQVSKRQVTKPPVSKRLNRQVYKRSGLQNVRFSKRPIAKNIHIYSVLVVGGNPQVLLQPCLQAK